MRITRNLAESLRLGIYDAKMDLATGGDCHDHEPALNYGLNLAWGGGAVYNTAAEHAYWRTLEHAQPKTG